MIGIELALIELGEEVVRHLMTENWGGNWVDGFHVMPEDWII